MCEEAINRGCGNRGLNPMDDEAGNRGWGDNRGLNPMDDERGWGDNRGLNLLDDEEAYVEGGRL